MTYQVLWSFTAIQELARIANLAEDPARIQKASDWIDYALRRVPSELGESRSGMYRVWYDDVLGVYYLVDNEQMRVQVLAIQLSQRK